MSLSSESDNGIVVRHEYSHKNGRFEKESFTIGIERLLENYMIGCHMDYRTITLSREELKELMEALSKYDLPPEPQDIPPAV